MHVCVREAMIVIVVVYRTVYKANGYTYPVFGLIQREITLDVAWNIPASNLGPYRKALLFIKFRRIVVVDVIEFSCWCFYLSFIFKYNTIQRYLRQYNMNL